MLTNKISRRFVKSTDFSKENNPIEIMVSTTYCVSHGGFFYFQMLSIELSSLFLEFAAKQQGDILYKRAYE